MTLQELKDSQPELIEEIKNELAQENQGNADELVANALKTERERLQKIDSIAAKIGNSELVNRAKYEEPMDAERLAFEALQAQSAQGETYLAARQKETEGAKDIAGTANSGMEDTVAEDSAELNALVNKLKEGK